MIAKALVYREIGKSLYAYVGDQRYRIRPSETGTWEASRDEDHKELLLATTDTESAARAACQADADLCVLRGMCKEAREGLARGWDSIRYASRAGLHDMLQRIRHDEEEESQ